MNDWVVTKVWNLHSIPQALTCDSVGNIYFSKQVTIQTYGRISSICKLNVKESNTEPEQLVSKTELLFGAIVWSPDNSLYICDPNRNSIYSFDIKTQQFSVLAGNPTAGPMYQDGTLKRARFGWPCGIAIDNEKCLYISDCTSIREINLRTQMVDTIAGNKTFSPRYEDGECVSSAFGHLKGLAVTTDGSLLVCDHSNRCIRKIHNGMVSTIGHPDKPLFLYTPRALHVDTNGRILIVSGKGIKQWSEECETVTPYGLRRIDDCGAMASDCNGTVFVGFGEFLLKLEKTWKYERYLWIGKWKEETTYCHLASLPTDMIREIASHLHTSEFCKTQCVNSLP